MDISSTAMLQEEDKDKSGHSLGYSDSDSSVDHSESYGSHRQRRRQGKEEEEEDQDDDFTATLIEGLRPKTIPMHRQAQRSKRRKRRSAQPSGYCASLQRSFMAGCVWLGHCVQGSIGSGRDNVTEEEEDSGGGSRPPRVYRLDWPSVKAMYLSLREELEAGAAGGGGGGGGEGGEGAGAGAGAGFKMKVSKVCLDVGSSMCVWLCS
jgi:hypothetical protein